MKLLPRLAVLVTLIAFAYQIAIASSLTNDDLEFAFGGQNSTFDTTSAEKQVDTQLEKQPLPQQLASIQHLSAQEMRETEGAWLNFIIGGAIGLGSYLYSTPQLQWSWGGAARNTAYGLLGGGAFTTARYAVRPWARVGRSYSRSGNFGTYSISVGSNISYRNRSYLRHSSTLQNLNSRVRNYSFGNSSWRTRDLGHYHLWRR